MPTAGVVLQGIVNVTPDSFSDGGRFLDPSQAVAHGLRLLDEGADWLDVGGESTRPGSEPVDAVTEAARVVPVIAGLVAERPGVTISVDTSKAEVAAAAIEAGARIVNDVTALADPEMPGLCARTGVSVILMHMRGRPATMQHDTHYDDLVAAVGDGLLDRVAVAEAAGVSRDRIWVDPGVGFGKAPGDNPLLIRASGALAERTGCPVLIGASRKRFVGELTGVQAAADRVHGSVGAALAAVRFGARALRIHDVAATRQALLVYTACQEAR